MRTTFVGGSSLETACPLGCGPLERDPTVYRDNRFGLPHTVRIAWCPRCGLGVTLDPPSREELERLYGEAYADESTAGRVPRSGRLARVWHRLNGSLPLSDLQLAPPVLDVGANTGETLLALRRRGIEGVGVEPNPRAAAIAAGHGLEVIGAAVEEAELPAGAFGTVLLSQVLEHVEVPAQVLQIAAQALRPGGTAYIVVPNARSAWRRLFGRHWVHWHVPFHLHHFTATSLRLLSEQAGLRVRVTRNVTPGEWILMSLEATRNARRDVWTLRHFEGRYGRRLLLAPLARALDALGRGDALVVEAVRPPV